MDDMSNIPRMSDKGIMISTALAKAMLVFASQDLARTSMSGLVFSDGMVCATDGPTAVRVHNLDVSEANGCIPKRWDRRAWEGYYVREQIKSAGKSPTIFLSWDAAHANGADVAHAVNACVRERTIASDAPIGVNPHYLARIAELSLVLHGKPGRKGSVLPTCALVSAPGPLDPLVYEVTATETSSSTAVHGATTKTSTTVLVEVVIMPCRLG